MLILKAFQFRLKPSPDIAQQFSQIAGSCRFVFNKALGLHQKGSKFSYTNSANLLPSWKQQEETKWLKEPPSQALQQSLKDLEQAFIRHKTGSGFPNFKKKGKKDSFRIPQGFEIDQHNSRIFLPKIGFIRYYKHRNISGIPKNLTITRNLNSWDISIQTEQEVPDKIHKKLNNSIGLDLGVKNLLVSSEGTYIKPINSYQRNETKVSRLNQVLAKKEKGSVRRTYVLSKLRQVYGKIRSIRKDFIHKLTTKLTKNHGTIIVEDLNIQKMLETGSSSLNKGILDQSFGEIKRQLKYKLLWAGGQLIEVNPAYTSQTCNVCGVVDANSRVTRDKFLCTACGNESCADLNAAKNIKLKGSTFRRICDPLEPVVGQTMKRTKVRGKRIKCEPTFQI